MSEQLRGFYMKQTIGLSWAQVVSIGFFLLSGFFGLYFHMDGVHKEIRANNRELTKEIFEIKGRFSSFFLNSGIVKPEKDKVVVNLGNIPEPSKRERAAKEMKELMRLLENRQTKDAVQSPAKLEIGALDKEWVPARITKLKEDGEKEN
ncbi:MAG: hypothetical protein IPJ88_04905 [Myxococcales bacterium]|nr:MAG: hypothetical protein IPJ88_04905 [Myxococcales bacterium]